MKKVLVIGAAGSIGSLVIKYLLSEGKYEISALDLKNKRVINKLHSYKKRIKVIYGDITDKKLINSLIKENDYVINLASCLPPFSEYKKNITDIIDYGGVANIVNAINNINSKCYLIQSSTTSFYNNNPASVKDKIMVEEFNYFDKNKKAAEDLIIKKLKNYTILRIPLVLSDLNKDPFIYNIKLDSNLEVITKEDAARALVNSVNKSEIINKKIINIGGGKYNQITYNELIQKILKYHGISWNYILTSIFVPKNFKSPILLDSDESEKLLKYRNDSLDSYFIRLKNRSKKRKISKFFGKLISKILSKKMKTVSKK